MTHNLVNARYQPIENYGIIGNLHTVALVSREASIDFMSYMRFDSPTIFCKLLDADKGGSFVIIPQLKDAVTTRLLSHRWLSYYSMQGDQMHTS
jgi:GH15 family glucan-1,4-alpha-glucosidase